MSEKTPQPALLHSPGHAAALGRSLLPVLAVVALAVVMHLVVAPMVGGYAAQIIRVMGINIVLAVSLTMVNGFTGQFSMGHAGFMSVGGYAAAAMVFYATAFCHGPVEFFGGRFSYTGVGDFAGPLFTGGDALFVAACLVGGLVAAGCGYLVGLPSLRLRGDYLAIVTLGFGEIARIIIQGSRDQIPRAAPEVIRSTPIYELPLHLGGPKGLNLVPTYTTVFWVTLFVGLTVLVVYRIKQSSLGRAFLSIREDEVAAQAMGIDITRYKVRAFVLSAFFAGIAGGLYALDIGAINAGELGFQKSFDIIIMVVLGGMGSISGAVLAAIILTILPEQLRAFEQYRMVIYALALILMMILRPQGLFGVREVWDFFRPKSAKGGA